MSVSYIPDILKYLISLTYSSFMTECTFYRFLNFQIQISQNSKKARYALLPNNPRYILYSLNDLRNGDEQPTYTPEGV